MVLCVVVYRHSKEQEDNQMNTYKDEYGNRATIQEKFLLPFMGSQYKEKAFVLSVYSDYDDGFMYHRSVHESLMQAEKKLGTFSCGTFKEV